VPDNGTLWVPSNMTLEAWAKPKASAGFQDIVGKAGYELAVQPSGSGFVVEMQVSINGTWYTITSGQFAYGPWYHVAGTYDGSNMRVYVNGAQAASTPLTGNIDPSETGTTGTIIKPLRIGSVDGSGDTFVGNISEVRVSSIVRYTGAFAVPTTQFRPDVFTKGLWHLSDGAGGTAADASGYGNTANLIGGPTWSTDSPISPAAPDTTPPVISNIVASPADGGATITWTTDKPASSFVEYGPTSSYGLSTVNDVVPVTSHTVSVAALTPSSAYNYHVISTDVSGNQTISGNLTFTTTSAPASAATQGEWGPLQNWPLVPVSAAQLYNGLILVFDAWEMPGTPSVRLWNVNTGSFIPVANEWAQMFCSASVQLADGRLMIAGGHNGGETGNVNTAFFDPSKNMWIKGPDMNFPRWYASATTLGDGRVVDLSGEMTIDNFANTPEIYNPTTNTWTKLNISTPQIHEDQYPLSFAMPNGKMLTISPNTATTFTLDPNAQTWIQGPNSPVINGAAVQYRPGKYLFTGGGNDALTPDSQPTAAVLDVTGATPTWTSVTSMNAGRTYHNLVITPDGKVMAIGGSSSIDSSPNGPLFPELWDPSTGTWTNMAPQVDPRMYHSTALLLPDGRVLSAGGGRLPGTPTVDYPTAQVFSPPYLFKGPRPMITAAPTGVNYGASFTVSSPDAASITSAALVKLGSVTHTLDSDENYLSLNFTTNGNALTLTAPASSNTAPAGQYMLFILNSQGVPSVAKIMSLGGTSVTVPPPTISMTAPANGATISGTATVSANASSSVGIASVQFQLDGASLGSPVTAAPYQLSWDSTKVANGAHTLGAVATDTQGNAGSATTVSVTVSNAPPPPPTVSMTAPANGATVSGTVTVSANASSGAGIKNVQFQLDGASLGSPDTATPYQINWNTTSATNGSHTLGAVATDVQNQTTSATTVSVTVNNPPVISAVTATNISQTGATITWTTNSASSSEVDYGTTASYGTVVTNAAPVTSHSIALSGLSASTTYHFQVKSTDAQNNTTTSADSTFTTLGNTPVTLVGDTKIESAVDNNAAGSAEAFQYTATTAGSVTQLSIYIDAANAATKITVGLYTDSNGNPGGLLTQGTISSPTKGAWNNLAVSSANVTAGTKYWIAALSPTGSGNMYFRDIASGGGPTQASAQSNLSTLPATWSAGANYANAPMSAYAAQAGPPDTTPPTVSLTSPTGGATVTGPVTLTATASDPDSPVSYVQFTLDGANLGAAITAAPYQMTWDSTTVGNGPHSIGAKAADPAGNIGTATSVSVTVSNPPTISNPNVTNITPTGAVVNWTTNTPASSEVDYGTTTSYGSTVSNPALVTGHSESLTGLTPNTKYFCQLVSVDSLNNKVTYTNLSFTTATVSPTRLLGDPNIEASVDNNAAGSAEAFTYTATATGTVNQLSVYLDASNSATSVVVGLYTDSNNNPATLLTSGTIAAPTRGAWNNLTVPNAAVTSGTKYWIAVLGPTGAGTVQFRDIASGGGKTVASAQNNLTALPATWTSGAVYANSPLSAYASNAP
jgi:hypothetical protein